jgi:hypothetical protein
MDIEQVASTNAAASQPQVVPAGTEHTPNATPDLENDWNDRFAKLTLRERQIMNERKAMQEKLKRLERLEALKDDPDSILKEFGHSYDSLTERRLEKPKSIEQQMIEELKAELQDLKGWKTERTTREQQDEQARMMQALHAQVDTILQSDESLEWTRHLGEQQLVIDTAAQFYAATGKKVDLAEAAKWVEKHLEDKYDGLKETKKWSAKYQPPSGQSAPSTTPQSAVERAVAQSADRKGETTSLSSSMAASPTPAAQGPDSEEVMRQRAIRILAEGWKGG